MPNTYRIVADRTLAPITDAFCRDWGMAIDEKQGTLIRIQSDPSLAEEEFHLQIGKTISIKSASRVGTAWALSTLGERLQGLKVKAETIRDMPGVGFRCLLLDVARRYHSPSTIRTMIRWCNVAKIPILLLHLTDDQNWMLPSSAVPGVDRLNTHGKPAYTKQELAELQRFAEARGVSIVPEVDLPGHSLLLVKSNPSLFQIQGSEGNYCVNFGSPEVRKKLKELLAEVYALFPKAPYIHIGGDEAWYPNAEKDPHMAVSAKAIGAKAAVQDVFVDFVSELADHVIASGRTPIVWEGFAASEFAKKRVPKKTLLVAWEGHYYPVKQLVPDGFKVVNAGWDPYYVVNHYPYDVNTLVPLERLLNSSHLTFGIVNWTNKAAASLQFQDSKAVQGGLMCWWEGQEWNTHTLLPARILAFGESLWSPGKRSGYEALLARTERVGRAIDKARLPFEVKIEGTLGGTSKQFQKRATLLFSSPDNDIRIDVQTVSKQSGPNGGLGVSTYAVDQSQILAIQGFKGKVQIGETLFLPLKKVTVETSLTTGCPVTTDGGRDPQFSAGNLVDGISDDPTAYWLAYPRGTSATIDLRSPLEVRTLQVVTQWQNAAPTRYRAEGSLDGKSWQQLVDRSKNKEPATEKGYIDQISPVKVRHLKIVALGGELFPNNMSRILEVRAY